MVGQTYTTNNCGPLIVLSGPDKTNGYKYLVEFINTGYKNWVSSYAIKHGQVRDPFVPSVFGVGIVGNIDLNRYHKLAALWRDILSRCYNNKDTCYSRYGAVGVIVDSSWFMLSTFINDVINLPNWNYNQFLNGELHLDKDFLQPYSINKVYSKNTCIWIEADINVRIQDAQMRYFEAIPPDRSCRYIHNNITDFVDQFSQIGFTRKGISGCLNRIDVNTHRGWKFRFI